MGQYDVHIHVSFEAKLDLFRAYGAANTSLVILAVKSSSMNAILFWYVVVEKGFTKTP